MILAHPAKGPRIGKLFRVSCKSPAAAFAGNFASMYTFTVAPSLLLVDLPRHALHTLPTVVIDNVCEQRRYPVHGLYI